MSGISGASIVECPVEYFTGQVLNGDMDEPDQQETTNAVAVLRRIETLRRQTYNVWLH